MQTHHRLDSLRPGPRSERSPHHQLLDCRDFIYRICFRFLRHPEEAQDLAQDVFLLAYRNLHRFQGNSSLKTWLYRIVENHCLNRLRRPAASSLDDEAAREVPDPTLADHAVEGTLYDQQLREAIERRARTRTPAWDREDYLIFEAYYGSERRTWAQIAAQLGRPVDTVKYHFYQHVLPTLREVGEEFRGE